MSEKTVKLSIPAELEEMFAEANREVLEMCGFAPGVEALMIMSLSKESVDEIVDDFNRAMSDFKKRRRSAAENASQAGTEK
jgi:elongation factor P--beta-lysine ligase